MIISSKNHVAETTKSFLTLHLSCLLHKTQLSSLFHPDGPYYGLSTLKIISLPSTMPPLPSPDTVFDTSLSPNATYMEVQAYRWTLGIPGPVDRWFLQNTCTTHIAFLVDYLMLPNVRCAGAHSRIRRSAGGHAPA